MATKKISYNEAFTELQGILEKIESGEPDVDNLAEMVKKAAELIKICKTKLFETESEIEKILEDLDKED
jgi:exodeoxyribonuclease VII small subunit